MELDLDTVLNLGPLSYGVYSQDLLLLNLVNLNLVLNLYAVFVRTRLYL
eukprot:SAG31_NODE_1042_length_10187_cov_54.452121_19_plen_49_part_00